MPSLSAPRSLRESFVTDPPPQHEMEHRKNPVLRGKASIPLFPAELTNISSFSAIQISLRLMRSYECDGLRNPDLSPAADRWQNHRVLLRNQREKEIKKQAFVMACCGSHDMASGLAASEGRRAVKRQKFPGNERNKWRLSRPYSECLMEDEAENCEKEI